MQLEYKENTDYALAETECTGPMLMTRAMTAMLIENLKSSTIVIISFEAGDIGERCIRGTVR